MTQKYIITNGQRVKVDFYIKRQCQLCDEDFEALRDKWGGYCSKVCRLSAISEDIL